MALRWLCGGFGWLQVALRGRTSLERTGLKSRLRQIIYCAHDSLGQVPSGKRSWQHGTPVAGQQFEYAFDDIGNRKTAGRGGDHECIPSSGSLCLVRLRRQRSCPDPSAFWSTRRREGSVVRVQKFPDLSKKPGARIGPPAVSGRNRNMEHCSGFPRGQASEVTQLKQFRLLAVPHSELVQSVIESEQVVIRFDVWDFDLLDVEPLLAPSVTQRALPSRGVDQNAPHRLRRRAEEMRTILPCEIGRAHV